MAYIPIEYIEGTGTQYIITDYYPTNNTSIEIKVLQTEIVPWGTFYGVDDNLKFQQRDASENSYLFVYGYREIEVHNSSMMSEITTIYNHKNDMYINGEYIWYVPESVFESNYKLVILSGRTPGGDVEYVIAKCRVYGVKIWDNDTLIHDFIPVLDENNVACLYDKIDDRYLYNAGSGSFIAGGVIAPPIITIGTPTKTKISRVEGYDRSVVTFTSDMDLQAWEARATLPNVTPARGVGLLVESGTTLSANTEATIYIDDEELTNGDGEYTITVYGQSSGGVWSS